MKLHGGIYPQDTGVRQYPFGAGGSGGGLDEDLLPWLINVDVMMTPISHTNFNSITVDANGVLNGYKSTDSGTQNNEINFDVVLAAGTWTFELIHVKSSGVGIYSVQFDGVEKGTIDGYSAVTTYNNRSQITGIAVASTAKIRLKLKMATKNASSTNYNGVIQHIQLKRTA